MPGSTCCRIHTSKFDSRLGWRGLGGRAGSLARDPRPRVESAARGPRPCRPPVAAIRAHSYTAWPLARSRSLSLPLSPSLALDLSACFSPPLSRSPSLSLSLSLPLSLSLSLCFSLSFFSAIERGVSHSSSTGMSSGRSRPASAARARYSFQALARTAYVRKRFRAEPCPSPVCAHACPYCCVRVHTRIRWGKKKKECVIVCLCVGGVCVCCAVQCVCVCSQRRVCTD